MENEEVKNLEVKKKKKTVFSQQETFLAMPATPADEEAVLALSPIKQKMLKNLERRLGIVTYAAKDTGISREIHYKWLERDMEYKKAVDSLNNILLDYAETRLFRGIKEGDWRALSFLLQTKGRVRGYSKHKGDTPKTEHVMRMDPNNPKLAEIFGAI